jgi:hypothetical protein
MIWNSMPPLPDFSKVYQLPQLMFHEQSSLNPKKYPETIIDEIFA